MIPGLTGDAASPYLEEFSHKLVRSLKMLPIDDAENWQQGLVKVPKPYISAYEESGATVSGPPAILDLLLQSKKLPKASSIKFRVARRVEYLSSCTGSEVELGISCNSFNS